MVRNTDGLMRSARSRSENATQRATAAILLMETEEVDINFRSVAARAKVSTAWLYGTIWPLFGFPHFLHSNE